MKNKDFVFGSSNPRRAFIKSAGLLAGSTVLTGSGFSSCPVFTDSKRSETQGTLSGKLNLIDIHVHSCIKRYSPQELPQVPYFKKLKEQKLISETAYEKITCKNAYELLLG